jgi:hypothetical protein
MWAYQQHNDPICTQNTFPLEYLAVHIHLTELPFPLLKYYKKITVKCLMKIIGTLVLPLYPQNKLITWYT